MSSWQLDDTTDPTDMLYGLIEEHKIHLSLDIIILIKFFLHYSSQLDDIIASVVYVAHESDKNVRLVEGSIFLIDFSYCLGNRIL